MKFSMIGHHVAIGGVVLVGSVQAKCCTAVPLAQNAAVLIQLKTVAKRTARELLVDGWLACAPSQMADDFVARKPPRRRGE